MEADEKTEHTSFSQGCMAMRQLDWLSAIDYLSATLSANPKDQLALLNRGVSYYMAGKATYREAEHDFSALMELSPRDHNAYFNRAVVRMALGKLFEAEEDCTQAVNLLPDDARARLLRMTVIREQRNLSDEELRIQTKRVNRASLYNNENFKLVNRLSEAIADFRVALKLDEELASTYI